MAVEIGDVLGGIGSGYSYRLINAKDINVQQADELTGLADTDEFIVDDNAAGTQASTNRITAANMKTYFQTNVLATTVTVSDSTSNTNFPVVFHDESNALLDDTAALRYNPSTGTLLVPNLSVSGTTTQVDTVTMNAQNAVVFEGATPDDHETTLSIVDPTADRTQYLINQSGYIPLLQASTTTAITSTPEELNILDGVTATASELNILDGVTATATEINILDGLTASTAELNIMDGVTSTASELNILDGVTSSTSELNILDGVTATTSQINLLDGTTTGTVVASKTVAVDSNKDITGFRNITLTGELDAVSLDISGDVDIDGTLEADAITVNGATLSTVISNTVVNAALLASTVAISANNSANETVYPVFSDSATGYIGLESDTGLTYNPSTGLLTATAFSGNITGNVTGDVTGSSGSTTGNAATATALETSRDIGGVAFNGTASIDLPGVNTTGNQDTTGRASTASTLANARQIGGVPFNGSQNINLPGVNTAGNQSTSGNAGTATALETARNIGGVSFDGTANIDLPGVNTAGNQNTSGTAAVATDVTLTSYIGSDAQCFPVFGLTGAGNQSLQTDFSLQWNASSNVLTAPYFVGDLTGDVTGNVSGSSGSCTGNAATATLASTVTITDNESTNETNAIVFTSGGALEGGDLALESDGTLNYNPASGTLVATAFQGALSGNATTASLASTVSGAIQGNITTCVNLTTIGTIDTGVWEGTNIAIAHGGTGASNSDDWLNSRITTSADGSLNYDGTGATAVNHDSLAGFVANEHIDWTGASAGTIHATNYTNTTYDVMDTNNSYAAGLVPGGSATHNDTYLRKDGTWNAPPTATTITNYVTNDADDTMEGTLTIDKNYSGTAGAVIKGLVVDADQTGNLASNQILQVTGIEVDIENDSNSHASTASILNYGAKITVDTSVAGGNGAENYGLHITTTGAPTSTSYGLFINNVDGGEDIKLRSSANTGDYSTISTTTNGATTILTKDATGELANLTLDIDGDIELNADGGDIVFKDDTAPLATINSDGLTIRYDGNSHAVLNSVNGAGDFTISTVGNILGTGITNEFTLKNGTSAGDQYAVFGNGSEAVVLTSKSTQDIRLNTNSGTDSGFLHITDGADGLITLQPNGTGTLLLGVNGGSVQFATNTFLDSNGNPLFGTAVASSAVNTIELGNAATGDPAILKATGTDTNVPLTITTKGTGAVTVDSGSNIELNADGGSVTIKDNSASMASFTQGRIELYPTDAGDRLRINTSTNGVTVISTADNSGGNNANLTLDAAGDIVLDSANGNFIAKKDGAEFSVANSAYAGMIIGYQMIGEQAGHTTEVLTTSFAVTDANHRVKFVAPPSGKVEIEVQIYRNSISSNKLLYFGLSDNATYNSIGNTYEQLVGYADETDDFLITHKWTVSVTAGTTYEYWLGAKTSSTNLYLNWGGTAATRYPDFIMKATALPAATSEFAVYD